MNEAHAPAPVNTAGKVASVPVNAAKGVASVPANAAMGVTSVPVKAATGASSGPVNTAKGATSPVTSNVKAPVAVSSTHSPDCSLYLMLIHHLDDPSVDPQTTRATRQVH